MDKKKSAVPMEAKDEELPGMPEKTELELIGQAWVNQRLAVKKEQETLEEIASHVLKTMRDAKRDSFKVRAHDEVFAFDIIEATKLKVTKG